MESVGALERQRVKAMIERQHGKETQMTKTEREVFVVGNLPANVVTDIKAAKYGVSAPTAVAPTPPPSRPPRHPA